MTKAHAKAGAGLVRSPQGRGAFVFGLAASAAVAAIPLPALADAVPVRMAGVYSDLFGEPFYAKTAGAFSRGGFDVDAIALNNAGAVVAAIGGGSLEFGVGDLISGVKAIIAGVPILLVAGGGLYTSTDKSNPVILAVANNSQIRKPSDLIGKTIGVPTLVGLTTASLSAWLPQKNVPLDSVKIVEIPPSAAIPAVLRGTIDVALIAEPNITMARNDVRDIGHPYDAISNEFLVSVWYASKAWIQADKERARHAIRAIYDTARWSNAHHAETFAVLVRDGKMDGEQMKGMIRAQYATTLTPALIQPVLNIAAKVKIFDQPIDAAPLITQV